LSLALTRRPKLWYAGLMLYFAYGSNMHRPAMKRRCPGAHAIGQAILEGHRFFVGIDGWGSVAPSAGDIVHGVLWRLTPRDIAAFTHMNCCIRASTMSDFCRCASARGGSVRWSIVCGGAQLAVRSPVISR
jgi:hypothetical protein